MILDCDGDYVLFKLGLYYFVNAEISIYYGNKFRCHIFLHLRASAIVPRSKKL